ncbi:hypothetical protein FACS189444_3930 [Spirochaetia bacterium]|nr:hypothetical protein FACS189444_3930 [Spirochaetia bacterium]
MHEGRFLAGDCMDLRQRTEFAESVQKLLQKWRGEAQAVTAALGSREIALQALLCDPVINSTEAAVHIVDDLFEVNKQYIRQCI